jgi:hypothetical protein
MAADPSPAELTGRISASTGRLASMLLVRVPLILFSSIAPFLLAAGVLWWIEIPKSQFSAVVSTIILFTSYGLAGLLWGLQRLVNLLGVAVIVQFEQHSARGIDAVVDSLLARNAVADKGIETAAVRRQWERLVGETVQPAAGGRRWLLLPVRFARRLGLRFFRIPTAALERILRDLEQRGETHVSVASLRYEFRERLIALAIRQARWKLAFINGCGYALVVICVLIPLVAGWLSGSLGAGDAGQVLPRWHLSH